MLSLLKAMETFDYTIVKLKGEFCYQEKQGHYAVVTTQPQIMSEADMKIVRILEEDPHMIPYRYHFESRLKQFHEWKRLFDLYEGGLEEFSKGILRIGYLRFGFNRQKESIVYQEWAPAARYHEMERNQFGVWTIEIHDNGDSAIPHNSRVKFSFKNTKNKEVKLDPSWIKSTISVAPFDGVYWDPPTTERYKKYPRPRKPEVPHIYKAHVGMRSSEPRVSLRVLMDVVHSHVSTNITHGLNGFDVGQATRDSYFHTGERGYHTLWKSRLFNYSNWEVLRFLLSNLRWWLEEFKFDGFCFQGVTSMLYHHHGIDFAFTGDYEQYFGESTDVDAIVYMMLANDLIHSLVPDATVIADDISGMPGLAVQLKDGGVGFDFS
ncbi:hypothetical protein L1887_30253 [Cichorium endivia]|nr:hypothetical protein L1887_30252 [Cichorium endivia]KAI3502221.1 hypothetical protein L1887_30253 [Cichorium endivia]